MNTTKQFLTKADYASPLCKTIAVSINNSLLAGSPEDFYNPDGSKNIGGDDVKQQVGWF